MRYDAFISYSHAADNAAAPALQAALHAFARPWNRKRALYVFRDQTSLAASPELWPAIETALADARWLLLMASPEAAASHWVGREIEWWLAHRSVQTLLIVLTGGELAWDQAASDFDWQRTTCLPREVVSGRFAGEPLWVDLRWAKSADVLTLRHARFRQAVLDVAAPLHGRPKDELDGEDVRRFARMQRLRAGAIAGLAGLAVVAITAAWIAVGQRDEARRQATIAKAGRIAAQADLLRERGGPVDASVMLAAEALRMLDAIGERSADVDQPLRRALAGLPGSRGTLEVSADAMRLTPDGALLVATHTGDQTSVRTVPEGRPRGCAGDAVSPLRRPAEGERLWLIDAIGDDGAWCVVHALFSGNNTHALELWSATPLRQVARVTLPSQAGHVKPAVAAGGRWLAATDNAQTGDPSAAVTRLWRVDDDGRTGDPQTLPGMAVLAFSPDGRHLVTSAGLWRLPEREAAPGPIGEVTVPQRRIAWDVRPWKVAFSPDGSHLATQAGPDTKVVIWDLATGKDWLNASPPPGELLALAPGGTRLVIAGANDTTVWDAKLDVARAKLPLRSDAAALPGNGQALFVVPQISSIGLQSQRLLTLAEDPVATRSTRFPGNADGVKAVQFGNGGHVHFVELAGSGAPAGVAAQRSLAAADTLRLHHWDSRGGKWSTTATLAGVTAFALTAGGGTYTAAAGGQVIVGPADGSAPPQPLVPTAVAGMLAISGDATRVLAYVPAPSGGTIHLWHRAGGGHWSAAVEGTPSAMAVTRDGNTVLAVVAHGETTRAGMRVQLRRWRIVDPKDHAVIELGRHLRPPASICDVLRNRRESGTEIAGAAVRVAIADLTECGDAAAVSKWLVAAEERQATVFAPAGNPVARIDHAAKVLQAVVSADGREAVTLDEGGQVQQFAVEPMDLIAQACMRQPAPLTGELRMSLAAQAQAVDACGRTPDPERPPASRP